VARPIPSSGTLALQCILPPPLCERGRAGRRLQVAPLPAALAGPRSRTFCHLTAGDISRQRVAARRRFKPVLQRAGRWILARRGRVGLGLGRGWGARAADRSVVASLNNR